MKKILIALVCLISFLSASAQDSEKTFESMGYRDQSIVGIAGSLTYFIKIKPDDIIEKSQLVLKIRPSQVLNPNTSFIIISLKDEPVYTERLFGAITGSKFDTLVTIKIPLEKKYIQPDGRFVKIRIGARMSVGDEYCKDIDNPAVWINVRNSSSIQTFKQGGLLAYQRSLKETLQEFNKVYTPAIADLDDALAGGVVYSILKQATILDDITTGVYQPLDSLNKCVVTGVVNKLPSDIRNMIPALAKGQGFIMLTNPIGANMGKQVMVITAADAEGYKKTINVLANNRIMSSAFSDRLLIETAVTKASDHSNLPVVLSLEQLGSQPALMEGVGALKQNYAFTLADYNAIPKKLTFHLEAYFSLLKENDRGFINVYLNDNLVFSSILNDKKSIVEDIDLKPYLLTKNNGLTVEMRFHPGTNICKDGFANFFGMVNVKTSTITFSGEKTNSFYNFFNYPGEFRKSPLKFLVSPNLSSQITSAMGELIFQINSSTTPANTLILPTMVASDKATIDDAKGYNIIALLQRNDPYIKNFSSLPVNFSKDFQLYKDMEGNVSYSINDFSNSGIAQIFKERGSTFLLITSLSDTSNRTAFESVIRSFGTQFSSIESNVCIATSKGQSNFFFKLPEDSDIVSYRGDKNKLLIFWEKYKFWIVGVIIVLTIFGFFFVRNRVKLSQEIV